jgi:hypothetical protein
MSLAAFPVKISAHGAVAIPIKKDRNAKKTSTYTLSDVMGKVPGSVPHEEEILILYGSLFPLSLNPLGGKPASLSGSEWGPYLYFSFLIFFISHYHCHLSFSKLLLLGLSTHHCKYRFTGCYNMGPILYHMALRGIA